MQSKALGTHGELGRWLISDILAYSCLYWAGEVSECQYPAALAACTVSTNATTVTSP